MKLNYLSLVFALVAGVLGTQQKTSNLFGQSPMLGGSSSGGNILGGGLLNQTAAGGGGGLFNNKPQTSGTPLMGTGLGQAGGLGQSGSSICESSELCDYTILETLVMPPYLAHNNFYCPFCCYKLFSLGDLWYLAVVVLLQELLVDHTYYWIQLSIVCR